MLRRVLAKIPFSLIPLISIISGLVLSFLSLSIFFELSEDLMEEQRFHFDRVIIQTVTNWRSFELTRFMEFVTFLGSIKMLALLLGGSLLWLVLKRRNYWGAIFYLIAVAGGGLLNLGLKNMFGRVRPKGSLIVVEGYSYPSGHAMGSLIFYGFLGYLVVRSQHMKGWKISSALLFIIIIMGIGFSRIYLGVHYPSDVFAGYSAGTVWLILCIAGLESIFAYKKGTLPFMKRKRPQ